MAGRKRTSDTEPVSTRASKATKTDTTTPSTKTRGGGKKGPKSALPASTFKARALPLHLNITYTPPDTSDEAAPADPGFISATTLVPSSFSTGSYGWKGSKRIVVELQNTEGEPEDKEKEKVHVMLTINATVVGSKQAKEGVTEEHETKEGEESKDVEVHEVVEETSEPSKAAGDDTK